MRISNEHCDRCKKHYNEIYAFNFSEAIRYKGKLVVRPWLCPKCFLLEKEKVAKRAYNDIKGPLCHCGNVITNNDMFFCEQCYIKYREEGELQYEGHN